MAEQSNSLSTTNTSNAEAESKAANALDTAAALALIVHDVKNSLSLIGAELEDIVSRLDPESSEAKQLLRVGLENARINNGLLHLLGLYRTENNLLQPNITNVFVMDVLEDAVSRVVEQARRMDIRIHIEADDDLEWYLDALLLENMLNNSLTNSLRYTQDTIWVEAELKEGGLNVCVRDNGRGFPQGIVEFIDHPQTDLNFAGGSTGIGLYLSNIVAKMHQNQGRQGKVIVSNDQGARVDIWLP